MSASHQRQVSYSSSVIGIAAGSVARLQIRTGSSSSVRSFSASATASWRMASTWPLERFLTPAASSGDLLRALSSSARAYGAISSFLDFDLTPDVGFEVDAPGFAGGVPPDFSQAGAAGFFGSAAAVFLLGAAGFPADFFFAMSHVPQCAIESDAWGRR